MQSRKAFTLVELLVVVAIIGLLAGIAVVSVNSVRAKARDVKRIADLKQFAKLVAIYNAQNERLSFTGCIAAGTSITDCAKPADPAPAFNFSFASFKDPTGTATVCDNGSTASCQYSLDIANPMTDNFQFCFFLETNNNPVGNRGPYKLLADGSMLSGCDH